MPGPKTVVYGGHTCCVEIHMGRRLFIIDAGSGFEALGRAVAGTESKDGRIDLLLSHLHHDHISGLPFFAPILTGHSTLRIFCGNQGGESAKAALDTMFAPPLFPVTLDVLPGRVEHIGFKAGETLSFEDGIEICHLPAAASRGGQPATASTMAGAGSVTYRTWNMPMPGQMPTW